MNICDFKHFEKMRYLQNERLKYFFLNCNIPYCWRYFSSFYSESKTVSIRPFNPYWQVLEKPIQNFFQNFSFPSHEPEIITGRLIQNSIWELWARPYYLVTHAIENYEQIYDGWVFQHRARPSSSCHGYSPIMVKYGMAMVSLTVMILFNSCVHIFFV